MLLVCKASWNDCMDFESHVQTLDMLQTHASCCMTVKQQKHNHNLIFLSVITNTDIPFLSPWEKFIVNY